MYACPTCGAGLVFDPKSQQLLCKSCRNKYDPENSEGMRINKAVEKVEKNCYEAISYKCTHCGAELITTDETITTFCSFCRTGEMLEREVIQKRKPDYVIPFSITKEECEEIYRKKIKKSLFAPKNMKDEQEAKKIRGIYMPYWIYSFEKRGDVKTKGQKYNHRSGDYVYYDDYILETDVDAKVKGIPHDATSNFWDRLSEAIGPYSVSKKKIFSPAYLSGFYADNEDVDEEIYKKESKEIAQDHISQKLGKDKTFSKYSAAPNVSLDQENIELALFPVYFLATKNKKGDRIGYAVINGQTGKISADIPIDFKKLVFLALIVAIPIFILLNIYFTFNMTHMIALAILFNIITICALNKQNRRIKSRESKTDDKGVQFKEGNTDSTNKKSSKRSSYVKSVYVIISVYIFCSIVLPIICLRVRNTFIKNFIC